jgi:hypothetical protein
MKILLTRDNFREGVFARDSGLCVICQKPAQDAHHILERRLFPDSGFYLDNGVSLCGPHHMLAEATLLSCEELRAAAGIRAIVLPPGFDADVPYDKWGNEILRDGKRIQGEMLTESERKILIEDVGVMFSPYRKYPRTPHLPWSEGMSDDDVMIHNFSWTGQEVVITIKMDGENTTMYQDFLHARSINSNSHPSRSLVKALHGRICGDIPQGWRICGENLFATHSIHYKNLPSYFMMFSLWDDRDECLSWDETEEWAALLGLDMVPVLYCGPWDEDKIRNLHWQLWNGNQSEGYVVRPSGRFRFRDFRNLVAKFVRRGHITTESHWMHKAVVPNELVL